MSELSESVRERRVVRSEEEKSETAMMVSQQSHGNPFVGGAKTLIFYTFLLIAVPVIAYYVGKGYVLEGLLGYSKQQSFIYWAILSVIGIHGVLGLMILKAFREEVVVPARVITKLD